MAPGAVQAQEWWLSGLGVKQSWKLTEGAGVTVAVLGTGVAASQPDLAGSVFTGPDYTGSGRTPGGPYWGVDGTAAAAIIAGHGHGTGGETGLLGVAPAARILSVRVSLEPTDPLRSDQAITSRLPDAIADGIIYAVRYGARIIDLPLAPASAGQPGTTPAAAQAAEQAAVKYAVDHGTVLVAPAGDAGQVSGAASYPAAYPGVVAVGAVARDGQVAGFSARHGYVAVTAPGVNLVAANPDGGYPQISSTSTSSAIVAGVAALVWSRFPQLTAAQVRQALTGSATVTNAAVQGTRSSTQAGGGHGTVDAARAVALAASIARSGQPSPAASASRDTASPAAAPRP
ncbi:MAG: S8 family serine peptidase, partial [Streptosporangiaceae bacterium]